VPYASTQILLGNKNYKIEDAIHSTICQPCTKEHINYSKMVECSKASLKIQNKLKFSCKLSLFQRNDKNNLGRLYVFKSLKISQVNICTLSCNYLNILSLNKIQWFVFMFVYNSKSFC
jgi:hypothetical protein